VITDALTTIMTVLPLQAVPAPVDLSEDPPVLQRDPHPVISTTSCRNQRSWKPNSQGCQHPEVRSPFGLQPAPATTSCGSTTIQTP
jgi:hypothetical protein